MVRGTPQRKDHGWDAQEGQPNFVITYLVGTVGVAIVTAIGVIAAQNAGWIDDMQTTLRQIRLPSLPRSLQAPLDDITEGFTGRVRNADQSTTVLWQRGSESPRQTAKGGKQTNRGR